MLNCAPANAKNTGENMVLIFLMYSRIFSIICELAMPIPAANAPTIEDKPKAAASAEAPKHAAVAAASIGPSDLPLERKLIILG